MEESRSRRTPALLALALALLTWVAAYGLLGERVAVNGGLGWDGMLYGQFAQDFIAALRQGLAPYYASRLLPSAVVGAFAAVLGADLRSSQSVGNAFFVYNALLLAAACWVWQRIARELRLAPQLTVLGAAFLFLNWAVLKQWLYFPAQTDVTAFTLGLVLALFTLRGNRRGIAITAFVASFCWPSVLPLCGLLVLLPRPVTWSEPAGIAPWVVALAAGAVTAAVVLAIGFQPMYGAAPVSRPALPLSLLGVALYAFAVARAVPWLQLPGLLLPARARLPEVGLFAALWLLHFAAIQALLLKFGMQQEILSLKTFLVGTLTVAAARPAVFLLAHTLFWGPAILLLLLYARRAITAAAGISAGAALFCLGALAMALNSESRTLAFAYPMLVVSCIAALRERPISWPVVAAVVVGALVASRCYLPMNALAFPTPLQPGEDFGVFPRQWFWMSQGPWISWNGYAASAAFLAAAVTAGLLAWRVALAVARSRRSRET